VHTTTIRTKFALGDRVRFDSAMQQCSGSGKIAAIVIYEGGDYDYMIDVNDEHAYIQGGIREDELSLQSNAG
jgi:hypothetical protein